MCTVSAQEPVTIHLREQDGLPDREMYSILETPEGYIWMTGNDGITRYDGQEFVTLEHPEKRGLSMYSPVLDGKNRVWTVNLTGQIFYAQGTELVLFTDLSEELRGSLPNLYVLDNTLYVFTYRWAAAIDIDSKALQPIYTESTDGYHQPVTDGERLLFINDMQLQEIAPGRQVRTIAPFNSTELFGKTERYGVGFLVLLPDGDLLALRPTLDRPEGNRNVIARFNNGSFSRVNAIPEAISTATILKVHQPHNSLYSWFLTREGAYQCVVDEDGIKLQRSLLSQDDPSSMVVDRDGNTWFTTVNNGVFIVPNLNLTQLSVPEKDFIPTHSIALSPTELIVGGSEGSALGYNTKTKQWFDYGLNTNAAVVSMLHDSIRDEIHFFCNQYTLSRKRNSTTPASRQILQSNVKSAQIVKRDSLLFASSDTMGVVQFASDPNTRSTPDGLFNQRAYTSHYDPVTDRRFVGSFSRLYSWTPTEPIAEVKTEAGNSVLVRGFTTTSDGTLWLSTMTKGVYTWQNGYLRQQLSRDQGLASNKINAMSADGEVLWIATEEGIQAYNTTSGSIRTLRRSDGIKDFGIRSILPMQDGIYFTSSAGVFKMDRNLVFKPMAASTIRINQVRIADEVVSLDRELRFDSSETLGIEVGAVGLRASESFNFRYKLNEDDNWTTLPVGTHNLQFASLSAGTYNLQLQQVVAAGDEAQIQCLPFRVTRPWYQNPLTWSLIVGAAAAFGFLIYRERVRLREGKALKKLQDLQRSKELVNLKLENLRSQMDPHFIFNALNSIQEYIVTNQQDLAGDYLGKFADLIRTYLEQSSKGEITLQEELNTLHSYLELEKLRFEEKLNYSIEHCGELDPENVLIPTMLIQPYVENALKHGLLHRNNNRKLKIHFAAEVDRMLCCTITDNGVGREEAKRQKEKQQRKNRKSFATAATANRLELLNQGQMRKAGVRIIDLTVDGIATGTQVIVSIPYRELFSD